MRTYADGAALRVAAQVGLVVGAQQLDHIDHRAPRPAHHVERVVPGGAA